MLDDRKLQVLYAIIDHYILTGDPIGSRTITKKYDLGVSAATIRNEMSDLEELGFLGKPHTSAGRIPSDKAYRHYVDHFLAANLLETMQLHSILRMDAGEVSDAQMKELLELATNMLVQWTHYTAVGKVSDQADERLSHIRLLPVDAGLLLVVLAYAHKKVRNHLLPSAEEIPHEQAHQTVEKVNRILADADAKLPEALDFLKGGPEWMKNLHTLLTHQLIHNEAQYVLSGLSNIYNFPEFSEAGKAKDILLFFEDDSALAQLFTEDCEELVIRIGEENEEERLKDSAVLTASYAMGDQIGKIALIGPTRMDYAKSMRAIHMIADNLHAMFAPEDERKDG
mgnify:FL=1